MATWVATRMVTRISVLDSGRPGYFGLGSSATVTLRLHPWPPPPSLGPTYPSALEPSFCSKRLGCSGLGRTRAICFVAGRSPGVNELDSARRLHSPRSIRVAQAGRPGAAVGPLPSLIAYLKTMLVGISSSTGFVPKSEEFSRFFKHKIPPGNAFFKALDLYMLYSAPRKSCINAMLALVL
jgi:hypothetical protein